MAHCWKDKAKTWCVAHFVMVIIKIAMNNKDGLHTRSVRYRLLLHICLYGGTLTEVIGILNFEKDSKLDISKVDI